MIDVWVIVTAISFGYVVVGIFCDFEPEWDDEQQTYWAEDCFCGEPKSRHNRGFFKKRAKGCKSSGCVQYSKESEGEAAWKKLQLRTKLLLCAKEEQQK